jgi:DNA polymerase III delta subunit
MLYFFYGSDRDKARAALNKALEKAVRQAEILRITDAHVLADLSSALQGPGMFSKGRVVVFDSILGGENEEMGAKLSGALKEMRDSEEIFYILEGALDAATRKQVEKYAEKSEKFDAPKKEKDNTIFALANALQKGDRKALWVGLMREFSKGAAPEAVHGLLFWGAKQMYSKARGSGERATAEHLISTLAELPHEARRKGEDLEYALERFALSKPAVRA